MLTENTDLVPKPHDGVAKYKTSMRTEESGGKNSCGYLVLGCMTGIHIGKPFGYHDTLPQAFQGEKGWGNEPANRCHGAAWRRETVRRAAWDKSSWGGGERQ